MTAIAATKRIIETPKPASTPESREVTTIVGEVGRLYENPRFPTIAKKDNLVGTYLVRALKGKSDAFQATVVRTLSARKPFDWASLVHYMKNRNDVSTLLKEVWPSLTQDQRTDIIMRSADDNRTDFLTAIVDGKESSKGDRALAASRLADLGYLRASTPQGRAAYIIALSQHCPAVKALFDAYDRNSKAFPDITRDELAESMLGGDPKSVETFFKKNANHGRGQVAAAGGMIVAAQAGASRYLQEATATASVTSSLRHHDAEAKALSAKSAQFKHTAEVDEKYLANFAKRAGNATI